jgi:hypothetical protein
MKHRKRQKDQPPILRFYERFMRFDREHRRRVAMRILRNQRIMADLYDHFLI